MFGFLAPWALLGLGLLAIPIVLHIFKPRKVREMPFSSLRWLRASQHCMSKKIRWHQVLLLMLRAGFITVLVLALASPVLSSREAGQWTDRFIVLDVGRGMGYEGAGEAAPLELGKEIAERLMGQVSPGDRTAVLRVGTHVRAFGPMAADAGVYRNDLKATGVESGGAELTEVLGLVQPLREAGEHRGEKIELFFITDNAAHKWSQGAIDRFMRQMVRNQDGEADAAPAVEVNVVDVSPETVTNMWIADARLIERRREERRLLRVQVGATGHDPQTRMVRLTGLDGVSEQQRQVTVEPNTFGRVEFELPQDYDFAGQVARIDLEPSGGLAEDDAFWVNLDATAVTRVLVIEPELTQVAELQPGHHLRTALRTLDESAHGRIEVVRRSPEAVLGDEIAQADAIVMVEVPELSDGDLQSLEQRVREGAGLAVFFGPSVARDFYNQRFHDPLRPNDSLLPVRLGEAVQEEDFARLARMESGHALFRGLSDPVYGDLDNTRFISYFRLELVDAVRDAQTLAFIGDSEPAIIERDFGAGRVVVFNATANDAWTDLPRRRSYVPLVNRLVSQLAGGVHRGTFTVGSAATLPLPGNLSQPQVEVRTPTGDRLTPLVQQVRGRSMIRFETLDQVGVYEVTVRGNEDVETFPFVVQPDAAASFPTRVDASALESWWEPASVNVIRPESAADVLVGVDTRWLLTPWLLVAACVLLAAEMFFVHYLCPRANPHLSDSVINRRGFFQRSPGRRRADSTARPTRRSGGTVPPTPIGVDDGVAPSPTV